MRTPNMLTMTLNSALGLTLFLAVSGDSLAQRAVRPLVASAVESTHDGFLTATSNKRGAGVTVRYRLNGTPAANTPVTVMLQFRDVRAANGATARLYTTDGIRIDAAGPIALTAGTVREVPVQVTPAADGLYYLHVQTEQAGRSSVISVPIQVGNAPRMLAKPGILQVMPNGERVVSLPAQTQAK